MTEKMTDKVIVIGDSWSSAVDGNTGADRSGWPQMLGLQTAAVAGSRAGDWVARDLSEIVKEQHSVVMMSLMGNDALIAAADSCITVAEILTATRALHRVVEKLATKRVLVMLYALPERQLAVDILNGAIQASLCDMLNVMFFDTRKIIDHADIGADRIHPNAQGHSKIAAAALDVLRSYVSI